MSFLYPQFLLGFLAIAIPILIHLFNLQKPKKVLFPNVNLLKQVQQTTSKKLKVKHWLVLIARILFIACLVLVFAQPFLSNSNSPSKKGKRLASVYIDNSWSMQNELQGEKALDVAIKSGQQLVDIFHASTDYFLVTNEFDGKDQFIKSKDRMIDRLAEIGFAGNSRSANAILDRQHQTINEAGVEDKHILWFTDFQKSTVGELEKLTFDSTIQYHFVPIGTEENSNLSVDSVWLLNPLIKEGENNTVKFILKNSGTNHFKDLTIKLFIDEVQVNALVVNVQPKSIINESFIINIRGDGQHTAKIQFEDYPIIFDNEFYFTLNVSPKINILHIGEEIPELVAQVYANESIFNFQSYRVGDIDYSRINESNIIILSNIESIPTSIFRPIQQFVENGGSLVIIPSKNPSIDSYKDFGKVLGITGIQKIIADTALRNQSEINAPDYSNPFFENIFEKKDENLSMPYAIPSIDWGIRSEVLFKYKNNKPVLVKKMVKTGSVFLFSSSLHPEVSNWSRHALFVPMMYKLAFNSLRATERIYNYFDDKFVVLKENEVLQKEGLLELKNKAWNIIPAQRFVNGNYILELPAQLTESGIYSLEKQDTISRFIALNYAKKESAISGYSMDELKGIFEKYKNVKVYEIASGDEFKSVFQENTVGIPLWKYFLMGALFFLLLEILFIRIKP